MTDGSSARRGGGSADGEKLRPPLLPQLVRRQLGAAVQLLENRTLECADRCLRLAMSAAQRLFDGPIDYPKRLEVGRGDLHRLGSLGRLVGGPPQDGRAALRGNNRINRVLKHQHAVGRSYRDSAA